MTIRYTPLTPALGALVEDITLADLTPDAFRQLYAIWQKHHVLVVRRQSLTDAQFERFAALLGEPEAPPDQGDCDTAWHTGLPHLERPPFASMLFAAELPGTGGDTWFASMPAALRSMPRDLVQRVARMAIRHEGTLHPIVIVQPETGEETLYLGRRRNARIADLPPQESERLLNIIWSYATAEAVTLRHPWQPGDVMLWNNLTTMHRRDGLPPATLRNLRRAQIRGRYTLSAPIQKEAA